MQAAYWGGSHFASKPAIDRLVPPLPIDYSSNAESLCGVAKTFKEVRTILTALHKAGFRTSQLREWAIHWEGRSEGGCNDVPP